MSIHFTVTANFPGQRLPSERNYFVTSESIARKKALNDGASIVYKITGVTQTIWNQKYIGRDYGVYLLRAIAFQIEAGVQTVVAVQTAIESESDPKIRARLQPAMDALSGGAAISDALFETGFYDSTIKSILMAGERTGSANAITSALKHLEEKKLSKRGFIVAIVALFMELSTSLTVPPMISEMVIPWMREHLPKKTPEQFEKFNSQLNTLEFNNMVWIWVGDSLVAISVGLFVAWLVNPKARDWITNKVLMKIPLVSEWYVSDALARSSKIFASMLEGGVLINDAIDTLLRTTNNPVANQFWRSSKIAMERGASTEKAFSASGLLRKDELVVLASCRGNSQIAHAFKSISEERLWRKKMLGGRIFKMSILIMFAHIAITMLIGFRLFGIFNAGLDVNMENMTQGI